MPLITTLAGASARGYGGLRAATPSLTGYVSISSAEVTSGGTSTIVFDNIPNVYQHLELRWIARNNRSASSIDYLVINFNDDTTGANYQTQRYYTQGGTITADNVSGTGCIFGWCAGDGAVSNVFAQGVATIPDYALTTKRKTVTGWSTMDNNPNTSSRYGGIANIGSVWNSTSAITKISISSVVGTSISQYSIISLYGIK